MISEDTQRAPSLVTGCSGWNYPDTPNKGGGWTEVFYPDKEQKDYVTTLSFLKPQKRIPHFITDSIQK